MAKVRTKPAARRTVFLSYCHADYQDARDCVKWLRPMCRDPADPLSEPQLWVDYEALKGGDAWRAAILAAIETADVFIVLMSIDYATSDFCMDKELRRMLLKREQGRARVIGVALHDVRLGDFTVVDGDRTLRLEELQCLPQGPVRTGASSRLGLKPLSKWREPRDAWHAVRTQIEGALAIGATQLAMPAPAQRPASPPPPAAAALDAATLPFLCDRDDQQFRLHERLGEWRDSGSRRPMLVVTEGRYVDSPQEWVERMHGFEIAAVLDIFASQGMSFGLPKVFRWPAAVAEVAEAAKRLRSAFAGTLGLNPTAPITAVHEAQSRPGLPSLWYAECADDAGSNAPLHALDALLGWLADWPDLEPRSMLVVTLIVIRDDAAPAGARAALGAAFESRLRTADAAGRVACVALGSLPEVDGPAVTAWATDPRVAPKLCAPLAQLRDQLPRERRQWAMRTFADTAARWLRAA